MPTYKATGIADDIRAVYLNSSGLTDKSLLSIINHEYEQLWQILAENDSPSGIEISGALTVPALTTAINSTSTPLIPIDLYLPKRIDERQAGGTETDWLPMTEKRNIPIEKQTDKLYYWSWKEEQIKLLGSTSIREIRIHYIKYFAPLAKMTDDVQIGYSRNYLAAASASVAANTILHNPTLASIIKNEYVVPKLATLLNNSARKDQSLPFRHMVYVRRGLMSRSR